MQTADWLQSIVLVTSNIEHRLQCLGKTVYWLAERDAGERSMNKTAKAQTW